MLLLLLQEDGGGWQVLLRGWCGLVESLWWWRSWWAILLQLQWLLVAKGRTWLWLRQLLLHYLLGQRWRRASEVSCCWWWWWWRATQCDLVGGRGYIGRWLLRWLHAKLIQVLHGGANGFQQTGGHGWAVGNGFVGLPGAVLGVGLWVATSWWAVLHIDIGVGLGVALRLRLAVAAGQRGKVWWWWRRWCSIVGPGCKLWRWWGWRQCTTGTAVILLGMH